MRRLLFFAAYEFVSHRDSGFVVVRMDGATLVEQCAGRCPRAGFGRFRARWC